MKNLTQRINIYVLAPLIIVLTGILKSPDWCTTIKNQSEALFKSLEIVNFAGAIYIYYSSIFSPFAKYQKLQNRKYEVIKELVDSLNHDYQNKFNFSANIMLVKTAFFVRLEPVNGDNTKRKFQFKQRVFEVLREFGDPINKNLRLTVNQGVCGYAFRDAEIEGKPDAVGAIVGGEFNQNKDMKFTTKQEDLTKGLILVVSCPLIVKRGEGDHERKETIGVLNIHSKVEDSVVLLTDKDNANEVFLKKIAVLGKVFVHLHI